MTGVKVKKICKFGHTFYESSECPTCPTCEKLKEPASGFLAFLSSPARNTLLHHDPNRRGTFKDFAGNWWSVATQLT
jgi:hypothetical protein